MVVSITTQLVEKLGKDLVALYQYDLIDIPLMRNREVHFLAVTESPNSLPEISLPWIGPSVGLQLFTLAEFNAAQDVFPLEFLGMKNGHRLIAGDDLLQSLNLSPEKVRQEAEYILRTALLRLRSVRALAPRGHVKAVVQAVADTVLASRGFLSIAGKGVSNDAVAVIAGIAALFELNLNSIQAVAVAQSYSNIRNVAEQVAIELTELCAKVDQWTE